MLNIKDSIAEDDLDEEDYEENPYTPVDSALCRIIELKLEDNYTFSIIVDDNLDTLQTVRQRLSTERRATLVVKKSYIESQKQKFFFSCVKDQNVFVFPAADECLTIKKLIQTHCLSDIIDNEKMLLCFYKDDIKHTPVPADPNELFRIAVHVNYSANSVQDNKIFIGKAEPKPEIAILNILGEEEWISGINEIEIEDISLTKIQVLYTKLEAHFATITIEFQSSSKKIGCLENIKFILEYSQKEVNENRGVTRHYYVKKYNRFGIKQKRMIWLDFDKLSFHISEIDSKNHKEFSIRHIKKFIKKVNSSQLKIHFYKEISSKNLQILFSNENELDEFLEFAQQLQKSLRETKFQAKQSLIFEDNLTGLPNLRKFTWLNKENSKEAVQMNEENYFNYNILILGKVFQEKRYLVLNLTTQEILIVNKEKKILRHFKVQNLDIKYYTADPFTLELLSQKTNIEVIFSSVYLKHHFSSHFYLKKHPLKLTPSPTLKFSKIQVFAATWNLGQKAEPSEAILNLLLSKTENHEILALGFQECKKISHWLKELSEYLEEKSFSLLSYISMWDMFLVTFIKSDLHPFVYDIKTLKKATGLANIIGNKGGVLLAFRLEDTSFCFVSCHLAARESRLALRNQNARDLLLLKPSLPYLEFSLEFDYCFFLGDLNYRIEENYYEAISLIDSDLGKLVEKDQLFTQVQTNKIFRTYKEHLRNFRPTYRCIKDRHEWSNKREQTPSWTDRVLYRGFGEIEPNEYTAVNECFGSDHRPVISSFSLDLKFWHIPEDLHLDLEETKLGVIEILDLEIGYLEETNATHAMVSFVSPFLEGSPKTSQVLIGSEKKIVFQSSNIPVLNFIFSCPEVIKKLRVVLVLWLISEGEVFPAAGASLMLEKVVEYVGGFVDFKENDTFSTNRGDFFKQDLEFASRVVGEVNGEWTFNICKKSDQNRF